MTFFESLVIDGFGISIVFAVLISLSLIIKLVSIIVRQFKKPESITDQPAMRELQTFAYADGEVKLIDVDEKTAALIMAIISDQEEIPLSELHFKSIRLL